MNDKKTGINQNVIDEIRLFAEKYGLSKVILFGSRARGDFKTTSDIDLAYETYQDTMLYKDAIYKEILNAYYDDRYRNNSIDIMYIDDLDKSSILYHEIQSGVILKDFRRLNNDKFTW